MSTKKVIGIIGGLGALASADVFFKLVKASPLRSEKNTHEFIFEQRIFDAKNIAGLSQSNQTARKLYIYDLIKDFEKRHVDTVVLPCFISHTFLSELKSEVKIPIVDMLEALKYYIQMKHPIAKKIGVLTSDFVQNKKLFNDLKFSEGFEIVFPSEKAQAELMEAIYGKNGLQAGCLQGESILKIQSACLDLVSKGVDLIVPGFTEIPLVIEHMNIYDVPVLDANKIYAEYVLDQKESGFNLDFKIGVIGGVGPAATTDFMNKIIKNTSAKCDQEHVKLIVEHNPQIPDRTEHLISNGSDPTVALYSASKKLESNEAKIIVIPCNTAHAFVERIQPYLSIPIINMLHETVECIKNRYRTVQKIGLLATTGTINSRVYHDIVEKAKLSVVTPDNAHQKLVMDSIYGEKGVKAGFTQGQCYSDIMAALEHLVEMGSEVIILGCTELPLLISQNENFLVGQKRVIVLDPTEILAIKCVHLAKEYWASQS